MQGLQRALQGLDEPAFCQGMLRVSEPVAIMLPDGDLAAAHDPTFVKWLVEHGEPAPFGQDGETKLDPRVRSAIRLSARGAARVDGFDPAYVLPEIERTLSPGRHLEACLTDVIVYPVGGHFAAHKDTPSSAALVGTLVVGLPIAHSGGGFEVVDGETHVIDWSGPVERDELQWVAVFSDVDHAIEPVTAGHRVTLVYSLLLTDQPRADRERGQRIAALQAAASRLQLPATGPLMIACTRHVIAIDGEQPQPIETLRGVDRDIADVLVGAGLRVVVRTCVAAQVVEMDNEAPFRSEDEVHYARLEKPLLEHEVAALLECVVFDNAWGDGGGYFDDDASTLQPWIAGRVGAENWLFRARAATTFMRAVDFADDGFVGNGAVESHLYKLAALEVTSHAVAES